VIAGLRGKDSVAEPCRKEGINQNLHYRWSKDFREAGKKRLAGDTAREATSDEVKEIQAQARQPKELVGRAALEPRSVQAAHRTGRRWWCRFVTDVLS
jgi:transposase